MFSAFSMFMMELSGNFFQEAYLTVVGNTEASGFPFPPFSSCTFSLFLSLCPFLRKDQRKDKEPWNVHTLPSASPVLTSASCSFHKKFCWWRARRIPVTISTTSATPAPCKSWAVLLLEGPGAGREQGLALLLLEVFCGPQNPHKEGTKRGRTRAQPSRAGTRRGAFRKAGEAHQAKGENEPGAGK